ncbi:hypothetical protein ACROYT_G016190 [Oculina patagonica]
MEVRIYAPQTVGSAKYFRTDSDKLRQAITSCILYLVGSNFRIPGHFFSSINPLFPRTKERRQNEQCTGEVLGEQLLEFRDENESDGSLQEAPEILFTPSEIDSVHAVY